MIINYISPNAALTPIWNIIDLKNQTSNNSQRGRWIMGSVTPNYWLVIAYHQAKQCKLLRDDEYNILLQLLHSRGPFY